MSVVVSLPGLLREHADGRSQLSVEVSDGTTVRALLDGLDAAHPGLVRRLRDEQGRLRRFVNVYVGDADIRDADGLETTLRDGDRILVLPSVAGGSGSTVRA